MGLSDAPPRLQRARDLVVVGDGDRAEALGDAVVDAAPRRRWRSRGSGSCACAGRPGSRGGRRRRRAGQRRRERAPRTRPRAAPPPPRTRRSAAAAAALLDQLRAAARGRPAGGGRRRCERRLVDRKAESGAARSSAPERPGATTAQPHARASQASDGSSPSRRRHEHVGGASTAARPSASSGRVAWTRPRAWAGGRTAASAAGCGGSTRGHELEAGVEAASLTSARTTARPSPCHSTATRVPFSAGERGADALGDDGVVAGIDRGRLLGGLGRRREQRVDARPVALERAAAHGVVQRPVGRMERGDGQPRRVPQRRGGDAGEQRLERVHDVEPALPRLRARRSRGRRPAGPRPGGGRAGAAASPAPPPPAAARRRARSAPRGHPPRARAAAAGRCAARASRSSVRAPSPGGPARPAPWRPRARARPPGGRRQVRTGTPGTA